VNPYLAFHHVTGHKGPYVLIGKARIYGQ